MNRLDPFSVSTHVYKTVEGHTIQIDVLVPKSTLEKKRSIPYGDNPRIPVILRYHGGWLVSLRTVILSDFLYHAHDYDFIVRWTEGLPKLVGTMGMRPRSQI